ncbi:MAG: hypothetical protein IID38_12655 [Planctomycetes bacterium]|nr:hypothetical protein [Planctomycetota bacterium]
MATRQRKVERRRLKRKDNLRRGRITVLQRRQRLGSDVHPIHACTANRFWQDDGKASIFLARNVGDGRVTMAAFLVDTLAMGLKDAWGEIDIPTGDFDDMVSRYEEQIEVAPINIGTVRHLVYGGIELARRLGFRLPRRYERWTAILGPLPPGESPDMSLFLEDGKINLCCSMRDLQERLIGATPEQFLSRSDVSFMLMDDDFTLLDGEKGEDAFQEQLADLQTKILEEARQWCFANGQVPHKLLPDVVAAALESLPADIDADADESEFPSADPCDPAALNAERFLSAKFSDNPAALDAAMDQFGAFMNTKGSSGELIRTLDLPPSR